MASATHRVLNTPELLEQILLFVGPSHDDPDVVSMRRLFVLQRVNRTFADAMTSSPILRYRMGRDYMPKRYIDKSKMEQYISLLFCWLHRSPVTRFGIDAAGVLHLYYDLILDRGGIPLFSGPLRLLSRATLCPCIPKEFKAKAPRPTWFNAKISRIKMPTEVHICVAVIDFYGRGKNTRYVETLEFEEGEGTLADVVGGIERIKMRDKFMHWLQAKLDFPFTHLLLPIFAVVGLFGLLRDIIGVLGRLSRNIYGLLAAWIVVLVVVGVVFPPPE